MAVRSATAPPAHAAVEYAAETHQKAEGESAPLKHNEPTQGATPARMAHEASASGSDPRRPVAAHSDSSVHYIDEEDRYSSLRLISWWRQELLARARVLVVGAGALGNEAVKNLALVGVGMIDIVDFDCVENSNLTRSVLFRGSDDGRPKAAVVAGRAHELNPDVIARAIHGDVVTRVGLGLFRAADVVLGCLDNREARLWVNRQCWKAGTPWVDAGIQEIQGVVKVFVPPDSACYECGMTSQDYQLLNLRYSCPMLRREDMQSGKVPTAPTIASMMAALQVQEALKLLHGMPVAAGCAMVYNGVANQFYTTHLPFRDDCLSHESYPDPLPLPLGNSATLRQLCQLAQATLGGPLTLALERDLVTSMQCPRCGWSADLLQPLCRVGQSQGLCPACQQPARPEILSAVDADSRWADRSLAELGIPPFDVVRIDGPNASGFFLLEGDRDSYHAT